MKIILHPDYIPRYDNTPAGDYGRLEPAIELLRKDSSYEFITPMPAKIEDIERAHKKSHIKSIKNWNFGHDERLYKIALLGAGGSILCANIAKEGEPAFGLIRPPGHHASSDSCWGFCYFNNIAVSLLHLKAASECKRALILDFDLHYGDGNVSILGSMKEYEILNPDAHNEKEYLDNVKRALDHAKPCDIIVASAGFDQGITDWGGLLSANSYFEIGKMMKNFSISKCKGRRYALLEGGYNFKDMAYNIEAFCEGFR